MLSGSAYHYLERYQEALGEYQEAVKLQPHNPVYHYHLGMAYSKTGDQYKTIEAYKQALFLNPDYEEAYYWLGVTYYNLGRIDEALGPHQTSSLVQCANG